MEENDASDGKVNEEERELFLLYYYI